ncbi:flagellar biosynthetic protein FliO [Helicobacter japonicus]|uniref:flagellar biosynthetic protein FliO n=1 Tax=Helicobacter japonicus TaxID=425400 RepID=UPI000AC05026|nr:flagellar biosynthetic protein FliO [Helicobacter japonicus]
MKWRIVYVLVCMFHMLYADTQVSNFELKQGEDTLEILLNLESVYEKSPHLTTQEGYKGVIFPHLQAKAHNQDFKKFFISEVQIFNIQENLYILGIGDTHFIDVQVSKAPHAFKVVFTKATPQPSMIDTLLQTPYKAEIPTIDIVQQPISSAPIPSPQIQKNEHTQSSLISFKDDMGIDTWRYVAVLCVMAILVLVLWIVKRFVVHKKPFKNYLKPFVSKQELFDPTKIEVVSQKNLDSKHKILTLESNGYRYLILIGASNTTLIDRYPIPQSITLEEQSRLDDQFAKLLDQKQERLARYLHSDKDHTL